jgi:hypothetical protein
VVVAARFRRHGAWPGLVLGVHTLKVVATNPAHEFQYALSIYLIAWLSLPLLLRQLSRARVVETSQYG